MQQTPGVLKLSLPSSKHRCSTSAGRQGTSEQDQSLGDIMSLCGDVTRLSS